MDKANAALAARTETRNRTMSEVIKWPGAERLVESVGGHDAGKAKHVIQHNKTRTGVT